MADFNFNETHKTPFVCVVWSAGFALVFNLCPDLGTAAQASGNRGSLLAKWRDQYVL